MLNRRGRLFLINAGLSAVAMVGLAEIFNMPIPSYETVMITAFIMSWVEMGG